MKVCSKCKVEKEEGEFNKNRARKDGLSHWCKACRVVYSKSDKYKEYRKVYQKSDKRREYKEVYLKSDKYKEHRKVYQKSAKYKEHRKSRHEERSSTDPLFRLTRRLRAAVRGGLKRQGYTKRSLTYQLLGADSDTVHQHLIDSAIRNYGSFTDISDYHIDHVIPCASANTEDELIKLQHYTNLQLLTPEDNMKKGDKTCGNTTLGVGPSTGASTTTDTR